MALPQRVAAGEAGASRRPPPARLRVAVRLRPFMSAEDEKKEGPCVRAAGTQGLEIVNWRNTNETLHYQFDILHGDRSSQQEVYLSSVRPVLPFLLAGQNASVFAYGPTGAGKTHTMLGSAEQPGIIPRAVRELFQLVREQQALPQGSEWDCSIGMSYLEIYNEKVLDLLEPRDQDLPIREDRERNIVIPGLALRPLSSFSDFDRLFVPASLKRTTACTRLNQRSSRSHAVLLVKVVKSQNVAPFRQLTGKLYLVDLAGSEDNRRTGNAGLRLKESGAINRSLFTLSKVVDALGQGLARVPYRDSKLTRLLQDSLGGSAHSVMITNIAPEFKHYYDTLTALNFAAKSKSIVNTPFVQESLRAPEPLMKRPRDEQGAGGSAQPQKKRPKEGQRQSQDQGPSPQPAQSSTDPAVLERLKTLERLILGTPQGERRMVLEGMEQSRKDIQKLQERQSQQQTKSGPPSCPSSSSAGLFCADRRPLQKKQCAAAPRQVLQAVVPPVHVVPPLQKCAIICRPEPAHKKKRDKQAVSPDMKENACSLDWEAQLDSELLEKSRQKILRVLNTGSLKDLKSLQQIGDKKAKLILGWRAVNGPFTQIEDLQQLEGISAKRLSSFIKVNVLCMLGH
ncbi:kinesin-like protein KIF22 [Lepisosteus oculatus]|uniref:kinesin-like protein KIF22 n=1 Tax=Lepisosteus oculatus TaxID=7918 RepID=UPI00371B1542